uniref:NADH-ubiquinone oxidoreductase chain 6 n=1 Tax=Anthaxia sp. ANT01 TaxID=1205539 RepID=A0A0S2MRK2_9COLE|nr:NADH deshydrogenase subunit 6 [Anthaxia sp. ANT01]
MIFTLIISLSFLLILLKHPLTMGFTLLIQSLLIAISTGMLNFNFWYSYILFIIMVGGMLVLFIYMTSIASNEMFSYSNKIALLIFSLQSIMMMIYMTMDKFWIYSNTMNSDMFKTDLLLMWTMSLSKYFNYPMNMIIIFLMIYLLITMIAIVKITNLSYGPLRQKF